MRPSQIRFPYEYDIAYRAKYGDARHYTGYNNPAPSPIHYALSDVKGQRIHQEYQLEKMRAERERKLAEIRDKALFQHKYPMYPGRREGYVPCNPISNGNRPFQTSQEGTPLIAHGSLATFPQHTLTGGVLKDYKYARFILDRRGKQLAQMNDPLYKPPQTAVLTVEEKQKLDLALMLKEVLTSLSDGSYTESTFIEARKLTSQLLTTLPMVEDEDEITELVKTIDNALEESETVNEPAANRQGLRQIQTEMDKKTAVLEKLSGLIYRVRRILVAYLERLQTGTMTLKDRQTLVRSIAKQIGLLQLADKTPKEIPVEELQRPAEAEQAAQAPPPPPPPGQPGPGGDGEEDLERDEYQIERLYANLNERYTHEDRLGGEYTFTPTQLRVLLRGIVNDTPPESIANVANIPRDYIAVALYELFFADPHFANNQIIQRYEYVPQVEEEYATLTEEYNAQREAAAQASAQGAEGTTLPEPVARAVAQAENEAPVGQPAAAATTAPPPPPPPTRQSSLAPARAQSVPAPAPERQPPPVASAASSGVAQRAAAETAQAAQAQAAAGPSYQFVHRIQAKDHSGTVRVLPVPANKTELRKATRAELEGLVQLLTNRGYDIGSRSDLQLRNEIMRRIPKQYEGIDIPEA